MSDYDLIDALIVCSNEEITEETSDIMLDYTDKRERKALKKMAENLLNAIKKVDEIIES